MASTEIEIAVLQTQMTEVKASLEVIKAEQHTNFQALATKIDNLANTPLEISDIHTRLKALERSKDREWLRNTASAAAGIIFATIVIYAIFRK